MKQQTAVMWLENQLIEMGVPLLRDEKSLIQQAKQIEKEQIKDAFDEGENKEFYKRPQAEQYYNETYGQ
jgi:hypothetical protein